MSKGAQQSPQSDTSMNALWGTVAIVAAALGIWFLFRDQIIYGVYWLKYHQAVWMSYFTSNLEGVVSYLKTVESGGVTFEEMLEVTELVSSYIAIPYIIILVLFAVILYLTNVGLRFRAAHSMRTLRDQEVANWPQIVPVSKLNLIEDDIDKGPWAMALSPMEFASKYRLLQRDQELENQSSKIVKTATIKAAETRRIFTMQLGPYWEGLEQLQQHQVALFAIFAARVNHDRDAADKLMHQIANSSADGKMDYSGCWALAQKYYQSEELLKIYSQHAYFYTVMASVLLQARDDGVLPTSEFLWLKPIDRRLWYVLNSLGRQTPYVEVAGVHSHWQAERALGRRLMVPKVDEAVTALRTAVKEVKLSQAVMDQLELSI